MRVLEIIFLALVYVPLAAIFAIEFWPDVRRHWAAWRRERYVRRLVRGPMRPRVDARWLARRLRCLLSGHAWLSSRSPASDPRERCVRCGRHGRVDRHAHPRWRLAHQSLRERLRCALRGRHELAELPPDPRDWSSWETFCLRCGGWVKVSAKQLRRWAIDLRALAVEREEEHAAMMEDLRRRFPRDMELAGELRELFGVMVDPARIMPLASVPNLSEEERELVYELTARLDGRVCTYCDVISDCRLSTEHIHGRCTPAHEESPDAH